MPFARMLALLFVFILAVPPVADARDYTARKKAGPYTVNMTIDRNPPIVDKNRLTLEILDSAGASVTDARVMVNYYMPPMPGMAPMNYTVAAGLSGRTYQTVMDLIMAGPWNIVVRISRGGSVTTVRFAIDVR